MKQLLLWLALLSACVSNAQYTITSASSPSIGETFGSVQINTAGIAMPITGQAIFWNYSAITLNTATSSVATYTMRSMSGVPNAS